MRRSSPPKPVVMVSLAALAVELPFLVTWLLVQWLRDCSHCRHEWLSWPVLAGVFPWYCATFSRAFRLNSISWPGKRER